MTTSSTAVSPPVGNNVISFSAEQPTPRSQINPPWTAGQWFGVRRHLVHTMFGKRHWAGEWVLGLCEADPQFLPHLVDQAPGYVHFVCLAKLALPEQTGHEDSLKYSIMLRTQSKKKILRTLWPSFPDGILGLLPKLPKKPLSKEDYRSLVRGLKNKSICKLLYHTNKLRCIDINLLCVIEDLPEKFQCGGIMNLIRDIDDCNFLSYLAKIVEHFKIKTTKREIDHVTRNMKQKHIAYFARWLIKKIDKNSFPPPPWPGNERVKPLDTADKLRDAADEFKNCSMDCLKDILFGYCYLYVCTSPKTMIRVSKNGILGWAIGDIKGVSNKSISFSLKRNVIQAFSDSGFYIKPGDSNLYRFFDFFDD